MVDCKEHKDKEVAGGLVMLQPRFEVFKKSHRDLWFCYFLCVVSLKFLESHIEIRGSAISYVSFL